MKGTEESAEAGAAFWFAKLRSDSVSRADRGRFMRWLSEDPAHQAAYADYESFWIAIGGAAADPAIVEMRREALSAAPEPSRFGWRAFASIAATLAILLISGTLLLKRPDLPSSPGETQIARVEGPSVLRTAVGQRSAVTLEDGTVVELNTDSELNVDYDGRLREVRLVKGQAAFEVAHDPSRPFVVEAAGQRIVALGTAFDVRVDEDGMRVTLIEGRVAVEAVDRARAATEPRRILAPGEQLVARPDQPVVVLAADVRQTESWRTGRLIFSDEPLGEVVEEINRYSTRKVVLADPNLAELRVSGVFRAGSVGSFTAAMETAFPVAAETREDEIVLAWR